MLPDAQRANFVDERYKMHTLSSSQLPELIKSFELKINQQKDVIQVKSGRPAAKMKLRNPREVLEIARLRVLISEMREKTTKMEAQLKCAAEKWEKERGNTLNAVQDGTKDEDRLNLHVEKIEMQEVDRKGGNEELASSQDNVKGNGANTEDFAQYVDLLAAKEGGLVRNNKDLQGSFKNAKKFLVEQGLKLDNNELELQAHIKTLQCDVNQILLDLSTRPDLQEELSAAKERIKGLQEEIQVDASTTKSQLLILKQQCGELEKRNNVSECTDLEFERASQMSKALEAELVELKKDNKDLLMQTQELSKKLTVVLEKAEKIKPVTKDDVLASKAEILRLRSTNAELQKNVESLQTSRFNDVEEVVYLRWVNACLRHDLDIYKSSRPNSDDSSNVEKCSPAVHGDNDLILCTYSCRSSSSHSNTLDNSASENDGQKVQEQAECSILQIPEGSSYLNSSHTSPTSTSYGQMKIHASPLTIPHGHVSSGHSSPLVSPVGHVNGTNSSPTTIPLPQADSSHILLPKNPLGRLKSSHASPKNSLHGVARTKSGALHSPQQMSQFNILSAQSPDAYNLQNYSPGRTAHERNAQRIAKIQSKLTISEQSSKLDITSYITTHPHNSPQRSGRSFTRSASTLSASSEGSVNRTQGINKVRDRKTFMRSSSTISADSGTATADHNLSASSTLRRHSASSVMEPSKRKDTTCVKAYSFESHLDASNRVVAAFQRLSTSTPTQNMHRTFKDLSRRSSFDDKAESKAQKEYKHDAHKSTAKSTQSDFVYDLARAIQATHYYSIEQVTAFVNWFDRQGEVETQEFFKFPEFPRDKVEAMRRAVYEHDELKALETELHTYHDELKGPANFSVQDLKTLLEKVDNYIQGFKQARELAIVQFIEFDIPTSWMLDSGMIAKIKLAAFQLAQRIIKQVTLQLKMQAERGVAFSENLLLESARFLLQIHNFAGGFDEKTANAFKLLRSQADILNSNGILGRQRSANEAVRLIHTQIDDVADLDFEDETGHPDSMPVHGSVEPKYDDEGNALGGGDVPSSDQSSSSSNDEI
ncbi:hypothetical protein L7F22_015713 [Adiantum nelumboides]|nr:hypothetical protein [Adiantum nelumboides]